LLCLVRKGFLLYLVEPVLQLIPEFLVHFLGQGRVEVTSLHEFICIHFTWVGLPRYDIVQLRLGKFRLVALIVAMAPVTQQIDENVLEKFLPVFHRQVGGERNSFGIVTVDVKDGCVNDLCDIGAVDTRPRIVIVGGKTHLVVDHEVNGTAGRKSGQPRHLHYLIDYTLTSHGGIAVNEDSHSFAQVSVVFIIDLATRIPQHQRVHRLQVGDRKSVV